MIAGNGDSAPVGLVEVNEEAAERAFAGLDNDLRYHFNLPESLEPTDRLTVSYDALNLHGDQADSRYGIEVYVNNVQVQSEIVIRPDHLGHRRRHRGRRVPDEERPGHRRRSRQARLKVGGGRQALQRPAPTP